MPKIKTEKDLISYINKNKSSVFLTSDFRKFGDYSQVSRILSKLIKSGTLARIGHGIYAKTKKSNLTNSTVLVKPLPDLAKEVLKRLNIKTVPSKFEESYNSGISNQVPTGRVIGVKKKTSRRIAFNKKSIHFEYID